MLIGKGDGTVEIQAGIAPLRQQGVSDRDQLSGWPLWLYKPSQFPPSPRHPSSAMETVPSAILAPSLPSHALSLPVEDHSLPPYPWEDDFEHFFFLDELAMVAEATPSTSLAPGQLDLPTDQCELLPLGKELVPPLALDKPLHMPPSEEQDPLAESLHGTLSDPLDNRRSEANRAEREVDPLGQTQGQSTNDSHVSRH